MCNPNSSVANRRFRTAAFSKSHLLTQNLVGSLASLGAKKDPSEYAVATKKRRDDPFEIEYSPSYGSVNNSNASFDPSQSSLIVTSSSGWRNNEPISSAECSGADPPISVSPQELFLQENLGVPMTMEKNTVPAKPKKKRRRPMSKPGLTAKASRSNLHLTS